MNNTFHCQGLPPLTNLLVASILHRHCAPFMHRFARFNIRIARMFNVDDFSDSREIKDGSD